MAYDFNMTPKQEKALKVLLDGGSYKKASEESGLAYNTVLKLKDNPKFKKMLAMACMDRVKGLLPPSIAKLEEIIKSDDKNLYSTQIKAIQTVFEYSRMKELATIIDSEEEKEITVNVKYV